MKEHCRKNPDWPFEKAVQDCVGLLYSSKNVSIINNKIFVEPPVAKPFYSRFCFVYLLKVSYGFIRFLYVTVIDKNV